MITGILNNVAAAQPQGPDERGVRNTVENTSVRRRGATSPLLRPRPERTYSKDQDTSTSRRICRYDLQAWTRFRSGTRPGFNIRCDCSMTIDHLALGRTKTTYNQDLIYSIG
jgi:hypothetical protein